MPDAVPSEFEQKRVILHDRIRGVNLQFRNGLYVFGPEGVGKTHDVCHFLDEDGADYYYHTGHLTPLGLFDLLCEHPDELGVLDDVAELLRQKIALQLLLAALGNRPGGKRIVKYKRQGQSRKVDFSGSLILISNFALGSDPLLRALKSRLDVVEYAPSAEQVAARMRELISKGWPADNLVLLPDECSVVADFVIEESEKLGCRLDLRVLMDKALPDFYQHKIGEADTDWKNLVRETLQAQAQEPPHALACPTTRQNRIKAERQIAREVFAQYPTRAERLQAWSQRLPGKSERAFYRRCQECGLTL
jgi:hypothetical protein